MSDSDGEGGAGGRQAVLQQGRVLLAAEPDPARGGAAELLKTLLRGLSVVLRARPQLSVQLPAVHQLTQTVRSGRYMQRIGHNCLCICLMSQSNDWREPHYSRYWLRVFCVPSPFLFLFFVAIFHTVILEPPSLAIYLLPKRHLTKANASSGIIDQE